MAYLAEQRSSVFVGPRMLAHLMGSIGKAAHSEIVLPTPHEGRNFTFPAGRLVLASVEHRFVKFGKRPRFSVPAIEGLSFYVGFKPVATVDLDFIPGLVSRMIADRQLVEINMTPPLDPWQECDIFYGGSDGLIVTDEP